MTTRDYHRPRPPTTTRRRPAGTARDRARLILALDGRSWAVADDADTECELRDLAERLAEALVVSVGGQS